MNDMLLSSIHHSFSHLVCDGLINGESVRHPIHEVRVLRERRDGAGSRALVLLLCVVDGDGGIGRDVGDVAADDRVHAHVAVRVTADDLLADVHCLTASLVTNGRRAVQEAPWWRETDSFSAHLLHIDNQFLHTSNDDVTMMI